MSNPEKEIKSIEKRLKKNPESPLFARLADLYLMEGDVDHAIEVCEAGLQKHPFYVTAHIVMSKCYAALGMGDQAKAELKRSLLFDPLTPSATKMLGDMLREEGWDNLYHDSMNRLAAMDPLNEEVQSQVMEFAPVGNKESLQETGDADIGIEDVDEGEFQAEDETEIGEIETDEIEDEPLDADELEGETGEESSDIEIDDSEASLDSTTDTELIVPQTDSPEEQVSDELDTSAEEETPEGAMEKLPAFEDEELNVDIPEEETVMAEGDEIAVGDDELSPEDQLLGVETLPDTGDDSDELQSEENEISTGEEAVEESLPEIEAAGDDVSLSETGEEQESWNEIAEGEADAWDTAMGELPEDADTALPEPSESVLEPDTDAEEVEESELPDEMEETLQMEDELPEGSLEDISPEKTEELDNILAEEDDSVGSGTDTLGSLGGDSDLEWDDSIEPVIEEEAAESGLPFETVDEGLPDENGIQDMEMPSEITEDGIGAGDEELPFSSDEVEELSETSEEELPVTEDSLPEPGLDTFETGELSEEETGDDSLPPLDDDSGILEEEEQESGLDLTEDDTEEFSDSFNGIDAEDISLEIEDDEDTIPEAGPEDLEISLEDDADIPLEGEEIGDDLLEELEDSVNLEEEKPELLEGAGLENELEGETWEADSADELTSTGKIIDPLEAEIDDEDLLGSEMDEDDLGTVAEIEDESDVSLLPAADEEMSEKLGMDEDELEKAIDSKIDSETADEDDFGSEIDPESGEELKSGMERELRESDELPGVEKSLRDDEELSLSGLDTDSEEHDEEEFDFGIELRDIEDFESEAALRPEGDEDDLEGREFDTREADELKTGEGRELRDQDSGELDGFSGISADEEGIPSGMERGARETDDDLLTGDREFETGAEDELKTGIYRESSGDDTDSPETEIPDSMEEAGELSEAFATLTLGEIYISQGQYDNAIDVYKKLKANNPDDKKIASKLRKVQRLKRNEKKAKNESDAD